MAVGLKWVGLRRGSLGEGAVGGCGYGQEVGGAQNKMQCSDPRLPQSTTVVRVAMGWSLDRKWVEPYVYCGRSFMWSLPR